MKLSHKVFFSTLLIIALIFGVGNTMLLNSVFRSAMEREERVTLDENQMLRFSFGTAAASAVATAESYGMMDALSDGTIRRIGWTLESSNNCCIRISDAERGTLYLSKSFQSSRDIPQILQIKLPLPHFHTAGRLHIVPSVLEKVHPAAAVFFQRPDQIPA